MKKDPNEICETLAFRVNTDYRLIRFSRCVFNEARTELSLIFLYDESIKAKLDGLKKRLEQEFKDLVGLELNYKFDYKCSYIDAQRLTLLVRVFLQNNFSMMTLDLDDEDIIVSEGNDGIFEVEIKLQKHAADYVRKSKALEAFIKQLREDYFRGINISITEKAANTEEIGSIEDIEAYVHANMQDTKISGVDKVFHVRNVEYLLGRPIKERPVKIEYLKVSPDDQVIAGTIKFLTRREFTKKDTQEKKPYFTFILDDGARKQSCVFFPNTNTLAKFEKLVDGTAVCVIGVNDEKNGRVNFSVKGVSFCELA